MKGHAAAVLLMTCLSGNILAAPVANDQASAPTKAATNPEAPQSIDPAVLASILKSLPTSDLAKLLASASGPQGGPAGAPSPATGSVGGATSGLTGPLDGATGGSLAPVTGAVGGLTKRQGGLPLDSLLKPVTGLLGGKRDEAAQQDSPLSALDIAALSSLLSGSSGGLSGLDGVTQGLPLGSTVSGLTGGK